MLILIFVLELVALLYLLIALKKMDKFLKKLEKVLEVLSENFENIMNQQQRLFLSSGEPPPKYVLYSDSNKVLGGPKREPFPPATPPIPPAKNPKVPQGRKPRNAEQKRKAALWMRKYHEKKRKEKAQKVRTPEPSEQLTPPEPSPPPAT